jgi:hypothetical protein
MVATSVWHWFRRVSCNFLLSSIYHISPLINSSASILPNSSFPVSSWGLTPHQNILILPQTIPKQLPLQGFSSSHLVRTSFHLLNIPRNMHIPPHQMICPPTTKPHRHPSPSTLGYLMRTLFTSQTSSSSSQPMDPAQNLQPRIFR